MLGEKVINDLKRDEEFKPKPYRCSKGKLTIGYGRNLDANGISEREAEELLRKDVIDANGALWRNFQWFEDLTHNRKRALINMMVNLGFPKFKLFKKMIAAFNLGDYERAADEALDSLWATQVGDRADRIANLIRLG